MYIYTHTKTHAKWEGPKQIQTYVIYFILQKIVFTLRSLSKDGLILHGGVGGGDKANPKLEQSSILLKNKLFFQNKYKIDVSCPEEPTTIQMYEQVFVPPAPNELLQCIHEYFYAFSSKLPHGGGQIGYQEIAVRVNIAKTKARLNFEGVLGP